MGPHWGCYWYPRPPQPASKSLSPMAPSSLGSCWHCPVPAACTSSCQVGFAPGLELPVEQTGGLQGTQHSRGVPLVTAKPQPGLGSALCPADARWPGARQGSRALQGSRQSCGLGIVWVGFLGFEFPFFLGFFFPFLQMSFIITRAFSDMEKTFLTSNMLRTVSKHLVFTSFPPPNYFALRNSSLPPPPPPSLGQPWWLCQLLSQRWCCLLPPRLAWDGAAGSPHAFGTVEMSL